MELKIEKEKGKMRLNEKKNYIFKLILFVSLNFFTCCSLYKIPTN